MQSKYDHAPLKDALLGLRNLRFNSKRLHGILDDRVLPSVVFAMRYPDNAGYVWNTIAQGRDNAASHLGSSSKCFIAYPKTSNDPTYNAKHLTPVELGCYDMSPQGKSALEAFILQHHVKVIVFMSALPTTIDLAFIKKLGVRTINTENDSFDHRQRDTIAKKALKFLVRRVFKRQLHDVHLANAGSQKAFLSSYAHIPSARLSLLTDGIDCQRFKPGNKTSARKQLNLDVDTFWIISVAQARPEKRLDYIIRAAKRVIESRPSEKIGFIYVGDSHGSLLNELKSLANELGIGKSFFFAGRQNHLVPYYQAANLMIHAAERESFGLAIVEAMACGLPVVASAAAGPKETIRHGETGALVDIEDFDTFVAQILHYVDNRTTAEKHGENGARRVANLYSLDRYGVELAAHIKRLL